MLGNFILSDFLMRLAQSVRISQTKRKFVLKKGAKLLSFIYS